MSKLLTITLILFPFWSFSQKDTVAHLYTFGTVANDVAEEIAPTSDGGLIIVGSTAGSGVGNTDVYLLKIDSSCNYEWSYALGGSNNDWGYSVKQTYDSGFIIAASTNSYGNGGYDAMLMKRDSLGNYQWQKLYGSDDWDFAYDVVQTYDSGFVFCGETYNNSNGYSDVFVVKTTALGDTVWTKTIGGNLIDKGNSIIQSRDSSVLVAGVKNTPNDSTQAYVIKLDFNGNIIWTNEYGGVGDDIANSIIETIDTNFFIVGTTSSFGAAQSDYYTLKITPSGSIIWQQYLSSPLIEVANDVLELPNGEFLLVGYTTSFGGGKKDAIIYKLSQSGAWLGKSATMGGLEDELATSVVVGQNGNMYYSGYTNTFGGGLNDAMVVRVDTLVKQQQFTTSHYSDIIPISVREITKNQSEIAVFPNPAIDKLEVNSTKIPVQLKIFNIYGNLIHEEMIYQPNSSISLKNISQGAYHVVFSTKTEVLKTEKLIILK
ncbi:MAG: T9SS type A sorting domain-containing protein [Flavobacteriales bacterium]|nr:T9SS type A sorting domain-containing protein [Flavobacteriales bacterium]